MAKIRVDAGAATPTRLAEAKARYARAKSDAILTQTRLNNAQDNFRSLTGITDTLSSAGRGAKFAKRYVECRDFAQSAHPDILLAKQLKMLQIRPLIHYKQQFGPRWPLAYRQTQE